MKKSIFLITWVLTKYYSGLLAIAQTSGVEALDIKDIKGVETIPYTFFLLYLLLVLILVVGSGFFIYKFLSKRKHVLKITPPRPPHVIAYERLDALKEKHLIDKGLIKMFYSELSLIVRHYLEDRFQIRAPEMTTEEFLASLKDASALNRDQKKLLKDFMAHCDLVKFAKYGPSLKESEDSFESSRTLIDQTKEDET